MSGLIYQKIMLVFAAIGALASASAAFAALYATAPIEREAQVELQVELPAIEYPKSNWHARGDRLYPPPQMREGVYTQ